MIRDTPEHTKMEHAIAVQTRRIQKGKRGYAGAVRRWLGTLGTVERAHVEQHLPVSDHDVAEIMSDKMEDNDNSAAYEYAFGTE